MGEFRLSREILACREWTPGWLPKDYWTPVQSNVPALVLTGALDDVTPPRYGEKAARSFTNAHTLVLPNRSHNDIDPCVSGIITDFVNAGSAKNLDSSCLAKTEDLSFALRADQLIN
jgi:pimeloyl-ACP methyl ester carboxylesterase